MYAKKETVRVSVLSGEANGDMEEMEIERKLSCPSPSKIKEVYNHLVYLSHLRS